MKPFQANLINAIALLGLGLWGYMEASSGAKISGADISPTVFIAPVSGLILLLLTGGIKKENKVVAHIAVFLTLLLVIALFMPFSKQIGMAKIRVGIMILTGAFALLTFIKSFIQARKA